MAKQRYFYIEVLRVIACFAVILLHTTNGILTNAAIYETETWKLANAISALTRFGVPIFLMISGYLSLTSSKEITLKEFLKKKLIRLGIPLMGWSIIYYLNTCYQNQTVFSISDFFFKFITMDISYHFWFMYTLIGIELFVPIFQKIVQNADRKLLWYFFGIIILPTTIMPLINKMFDIWLFRYEPVMLGYVGYFLLRIFASEQQISRKKDEGFFMEWEF